MTAQPVTFKDRYPELQYLVKEVMLVREHNIRCVAEDDHDHLLLFAEGALVLLALERFARIVLGPRATDRDTLPKLLEKAVKDGLLVLPWENQQDGIKKITVVRNTLLHGNYEQAARRAGCASVEEYFRSSQHISEVELLFNVLNHLMRQVDTRTGPDCPAGGGGP